MFSYIKPRKKSPITEEMQLVIIFFFVSFIMLFLTYLFLLYKEYRFIAQTQEIVQKREQLQANIIEVDAKIAFIGEQNRLYEKINTKNSVLRESIANLFDLVPKRVTLSEAKLDKNSLILHGIAPNEDVYNFMLQAPLRSIFHRTYSSFYPAKNGWIYFVSTNYIDTTEEELEGEN